MASYDQLPAFIRCLISFYGERAVANAPQVNHDELPRYLGREAEFREEWKQWQSIAKPKATSSEREAQRAASSRSILDRFR